MLSNSQFRWGVNYFLWDRDYSGECEVVNTKDGKQTSRKRNLNEYPIFIRSNIGVGIVNKVTEILLNPLRIMSNLEMYLGLLLRTEEVSQKQIVHQLHSSEGIGYVNQLDVLREEFVDRYKIMISSRTSEHAGEPDKSGQYRVLSTSKILPPKHGHRFVSNDWPI